MNTIQFLDSHIRTFYKGSVTLPYTSTATKIYLEYAGHQDMSVIANY